MSAPDDRLFDTQPQDSDGGGQGPNIIAAVLRRWPIVLLGIGFGMILGLLMYVQATPMYQSSAQILIVKKSSSLTQGSVGSTYAILEDYVGTQVTLLKSEQVLRAAANKVDRGQLHISTFPDDDNSRIEFLAKAMTVTRDKEGMTGSMGSNVLNLSFRCPHTADSAYLLNTIIKVYQNELAVVYESTTREQIETLNTYITDRDKDLNRLINQLQTLNKEMREASPEDFAAVQSRYMENGRLLAQMSRDLSETVFNLDTIKDAGKDPKDRLDLYSRLGKRIRTIDLTTENLTNVQNALAQARFKLKTIDSRYGTDHPLRLDAKAQVDYLEELFRKAHPGADFDNRRDELDTLRLNLESQKVFLEKQVELIDYKMKQDLKLGITIGTLSNNIQLVKDKIQKIELDIKEQQDKRNKLEVVKASGGYDAKAITNPSDGIKVAPSLTRTMALWLFLGVLAGVGLAVVVELTDKSFRTPAEIRRRLGLPVIGHIPPIRTSLPADNKAAVGNMEPIVVSHLRPKSTEAEAYRGVRTSLYFSTQGRGHQVIQVTSPNPGDGKSTLASNLAVSIAQSGKKVVLIDCDFRKPRVHKVFHIEKPEVGLASIITGESTIASSTRPTEIDNLFILPCGPRPANPAELLTSPEFQAVVDKLRADYEFVIIDTPPVLAVSDPLVVAPRVDGVLLVFRMTKKARPTAERAREQLGAIGANVLGVVVNGTGQKRDDYYGYGYGYNYGYGYQYQYQYEYEYADDYSDDEPSSPDVLAEVADRPPAKG